MSASTSHQAIPPRHVSPSHLRGRRQLGRLRRGSVLPGWLRLRLRLQRLRQLARLVQGEARGLGRGRRLVVVLQTDLGRDLGQVGGERAARGGDGGRRGGGTLRQRRLREGGEQVGEQRSAQHYKKSTT